MISENSLLPITQNDNTKLNIVMEDYICSEYDLADDKEVTNFIKDMKRIIRRSLPYRNLISFLRSSDGLGMNHCSILTNVSNESFRRVKIEVHHAPLTLEDICRIVMIRRMRNAEPMFIEAVAHEVLFCHYNLMVGLIPLSETVHEMVHNLYLFIPLDKLFGYYKLFIEAYYEYIPEEILNKLVELEKLTLDKSYEKAYQEALEIDYVSLDLNEDDQICNLNELKDSLVNKLAIMNKNREGIGIAPITHPQNIKIVNISEKIVR